MFPGYLSEDKGLAIGSSFDKLGPFPGRSETHGRYEKRYVLKSPLTAEAGLQNNELRQNNGFSHLFRDVAQIVHMYDNGIFSINVICRTETR